MLILLVIQSVVVAVLLVLVVSLLKSHAAILRRLHDAGFGIVDVDDDDDHEHEHEHGADDGFGGVEMADTDLRTRPEVPGLRPQGDGPVDIAGTSPKGSSIAVGIEGATHTTLLAFLSSSCITCSVFWEAFRLDPLLPGGARLVVVTQGGDRESPSKVAQLAPAGATTLMSDQAWDDYRVPGSPYFVLVGPGGRLLGEGSAMAWPQVEELIERALGDAAIRSGPSRNTAWRWKERERDTDAELMAAGIRPRDPSLYLDAPATDDRPRGADDAAD